jgi:hypothetical protein
MLKIILSIFAFIGSILAIFLGGKAKGESNEQKKQLKQENEDANENIKINKKVNNMSFDDKSDFLLSRQRNKNN